MGDELLASSDAVLAQLTIGIIAVNREGRVARINAAAEAMLRASAIPGGTPLKALGRIGAHLDAITHKAFEQSRSVFEREMTISSQEVVDIFCSPTEDPAGTILEIVPVQWHAQAAAHREARNRDMGLSMMLRGIAHEIRNPLTGIKGAAQLIMRNAGSEDAEYCEVILQEISRLGGLVDQLGDQSSASVHSVMLNIHAVTERVVALAEIGDEVEIIRDYDPSLPELRGQHDALIQALLNLVRNAVQAGATCVTLRTRIAMRELEESTSTRRWIVVSVLDDGPGIAEEMRQVIFFPMVSGRSEGSGLGLSIAERIARSHGGRLDLVDTPAGARFDVWLPLGEDP